MDYQPQDIERKWQQYWEENAVYKVENDPTRPKYYILDMFPYPSGAGLHVGHPLGYIASDIYARFKRLSGFNVLHPMGYDAFGLPAEQYAIQTGVHPAVSTAENMLRYRKQLDKLGFSFDWSRQVNTSDPNYYKWTQEIFLLLFQHYYNQTANKALPISELVAQFEKTGNIGLKAVSSQLESFDAAQWNAFSKKEQEEILMNYRLAYRKLSYVNWCEELGTVLANDEVKDGVSERGGYPVIKKPMLQWALRITAYADRLLSGLEEVDFSEALKVQQRNWIGRSEGASVFFNVMGHDNLHIEIFTTRPDTIFGATFMVLAPEHELLKVITTPEQKKAIEDYKRYCESRSERERMSDVKHVSGAFTGSYCVHPFTGAPIPIWTSEYVLAGYGTGAIMSVPSDDERDNRFAKYFNLPIIPVVDQSAYPNAEMGDKLGVLINSDFLNGLEVKEAIQKAIEAIETKQIGERRINFRLRDANFSRQRYWGEPFPIKYDKDGIPHIEHNLPLELPILESIKPTKDGQSPLARATEWVNTPDGMTREMDTMPGFAGSSWYYLRYMDANNDKEAFSKEAVSYWQNVDLYVGGAEHAVGHLMYSRFWHKFLYDLGKVPTTEPYKKLVNQGMIQGVIEHIYMLKEKRDGKAIFVSADLIQEERFAGQEFTQIPVHIDLVQEYGNTNLAHYLNKDGVRQFLEGRSDFVNAIFEYNDKGQIVTESEIGKMSKSKYNVINPDDVVAEYGADCFRMYEMFLGPLEQSKPWDTNGITGVSKFLRKVWSLFYDSEGNYLVVEEAADKKELKALHHTIKSIRFGLESFSFNTCVSDFMKLVNELKEIKCHKKEILTDFVLLLAPFAPYISEELWASLGNPSSLLQKGSYPTYNEAYLIDDEIEYPIAINGKVRAKLTFALDASQELMREEALALEAVQKWLEGQAVKKVIVVPKKMINIVV